MNLTLNKLMLNRGIYLPYLQSKNAPSIWLKLKQLQFITTTIIILFMASKFLIHSLLPLNNRIEYLLGDYLLLFGPARKGISLMFSLWGISTWLISINLLISTQSRHKNYQSWQKLDNVLRSGYFHQVGPFNMEIKLLIYLMNSQMILVAVGWVFLFIKTLMNFPREYSIMAIVYFPFCLIVGYVCVGLLADFIYIKCFHWYIFGRLFQDLARKLRCGKLREEVNLIAYLKQINMHYCELQKTFAFYRFICVNQVWVTFCNQILSFFYLLFANIPAEYKLFLLPFSVPNFVTGFLFHFFVGSYTSYQVKGDQLIAVD